MVSSMRSLQVLLLLLVATSVIVSAAPPTTNNECKAESEEDHCESPLTKQTTANAGDNADDNADDDDEEDWDEEEYTTGDMWNELGCDEIFEDVRPLHNESTWLLLRGAYLGVVGVKKSSISPVGFGQGFRVPYESKLAPGKGRGVFASTADNASIIPKGTLVWTATQNTARFDNGPDYRQFLRAIPVDLACDVIQWAYVQSFLDSDHEDDEDEDDYNYWDKDKDEMYVCCDLDDGALTNSGGWDEGVDSNIGCNPEMEHIIQGGCKQNAFALRDIHPGEEFLVSYGEFAITAGWSEFGL